MNANGGSLTESLQYTAFCVFRLIHEDKCAEAAVLLYNYHKENISFWIQLKATLIRLARTHRDLCLIATLLQASSKRCLSESCSVIPGLYSLILGKNHEAGSAENLC